MTLYYMMTLNINAVDQWRSQESSCQNTKRAKNGSIGIAYRKEDWDTKHATPYDQRGPKNQSNNINSGRR